MKGAVIICDKCKYSFRNRNLSSNNVKTGPLFQFLTRVLSLQLFSFYIKSFWFPHKLPPRREFHFPQKARATAYSNRKTLLPYAVALNCSRRDKGISIELFEGRFGGYREVFWVVLLIRSSNPFRYDQKIISEQFLSTGFAGIFN